MTQVMEFYGVLFEYFILFLAVVVVPVLGFGILFGIGSMFYEQAWCDRGRRAKDWNRPTVAQARSAAWVRLVKSTRKIRALRKEAAEYKPLEDNTWST